MIRRYLEGFGPATLLDAAQFLRLPRATVRRGLEGLPTLEGPDGAVLHDVPGGVVPDADVPAPPRLMAMWDSVLFAYADRSRVIPPDYRKHVIRTNGDTLPTLFVDGRVAGVWRATPEGVEVGAFARQPARVWQQVRVEARLLAELIAARDPLVYKRYARWWSTLPVSDVRTFR